MDDDAYGHEILNYFEGKPSFEVVERDDGYVNISRGADSYFSDYGKWEDHEKAGMRYAKGRCLDIGCGAGRVLLHLQKAGQYAVGIDTSPLAIKVCRLRGARNAKVMSIDKIGSFRKGSFDSITMFGNNFGLFSSRAKARDLLKKMQRVTSANATIIAESRDPYMTDNPAHFKYHAKNRRAGRMPGQLHIRIRFMQYKGKWFDYLLVSKNEMKDILRGTGWHVRKFIDAKGYGKNGIYMAVISKAT
jgi:SAM-dependent methyltransferase